MYTTVSIMQIMEKQNNKKEASSVQIICKKIEIDLQKEKEFFLKQNIKRHNRDKRSRESKRRDRTRTYRYYSTRQSKRND